MGNISAVAPQETLTVQKIYEWHKKRGDQQESRGYLGASSIGKECERYLWYCFRVIGGKPSHDGRLYRLFETGNLAESRFLAELRGIGCEVHEVGEDKKQIIRSTGIISILTFGVLIVDRVLQVWSDYQKVIPQAQGIISTIGAKTPNLQGDMWFAMLDGFGHLLLPTIALSIGSLAAYTRYARSSLLEVMNQDYVRTARAKGLAERTVIMRHAFRNAMIPIVTIVAFDIGGLIGGAIITERIFAWQGMGSLFNLGLQALDLNLVMGVFLITGFVAVIFNVVADIAYAALDPRIRLT
jgi:peptide/nickel transport system permease protein